MKRILVAVAATAALAVAAAPAAAAPDRMTITDTVLAVSGSSGFDSNHGDFDILRDALVATDLAGKFDGRKQYTVFAPTDQAFMDLVDADDEATAFATVASLGLDNVAAVLAYHVAKGARTADEVVPATRIRTLGGGWLTKDAGSATLVDATGREVPIVAPDAAIASNGVIHVIGGVLLPFAL
jgi:uncharacterized surface protein with fasciclin (FAS1) repeats